ncbi:MAG: MFS transporter [Capsulimonadales bacterium]|nr:MFS transporter [Capsulimonadales bacterium]
MFGRDRATPVADTPATLPQMAMLLMLGWALTNIAYAIYDLPLKFVLKDELGLNAQQISSFFALGVFTNYIKPLAGTLIDSVPLFGTRRRWYLLISLFLCGVGWLILGVVPRRYDIMLVTFALTYSMVMVISTTLGGVMVETAQRFDAAGRLTAQRIAMFRVGTLTGGPLGGVLATLPLLVTLSLSAALHFVLIPIVLTRLREPQVARANPRLWVEAASQFRGLVRSRTVLAAAGMICLIAASPGFGTPLLFFQTDTLRFSKPFLGLLTLVGAASGLLAAAVYHRVCQRLSMRKVLLGSIIVHAVGTLFYLLYRDSVSALLITVLEGVTLTLAMLPVYDLAARGTPKGSEALGYSVMMSVWNLTNSLSDFVGSSLFSRFGLTFSDLVWLNSGTTALVLLAIPLLPKALLDERDGHRLSS